MKEEAVRILEEACSATVCAGMCALEILWIKLGGEELYTRYPLSRIAEEVGFTVHEAYGIMDGWDEVAWGRKGGIFGWDYEGIRTLADMSPFDEWNFAVGSQQHDEYCAGRALGTQLALERREKGLL